MTSRHVRPLLQACLLGLLLTVQASAYLTDTNIRAVPDDGSLYDRDTWNAQNGSFPAVNATYTDPVFGEVVKRLTSTRPTAGDALNNRHRWNADGTKFIRQAAASASTVHVLTLTGTQVETSIPGGFGATHQFQWSPFDPDIYYFTDGTAILKQRNIATDTTSNVKTFAATLGTLGGDDLMAAHHSDDTANPTNLLFLVNYSSALHVWNQGTNTELTGTMTVSTLSWAGLSPDGKWLIRADLSSPNNFYSLPINFATGTVGNGTAAQTGTPFWLGVNFSDHAGIVTLTSGKTYLIVAASALERWTYRVDVSLDQTGNSTTVQAAANKRLFMTDASGQTGNSHFSCGVQGAMANYCWSSTEDYPETAAAPGTWYANKQEINLVYMPTGKVYRMVHHRSYPLNNLFAANARVSATYDGTHALFHSAFGQANAEASIGYSDTYYLDGTAVTQVKPWSRRRHGFD